MMAMQFDSEENLFDAGNVYYPKHPVQKWKLCRLCAKESYNSIQIFNEEGKNKQIEMKINTLLPIQVNVKDILPLQICLWCYSALEMAFKLQESSVAADKALMTLFGVEHQQIGANEELIEQPVDDDVDLPAQTSLHFYLDAPTIPVDSPIINEEDDIFDPASDTNILPIPVCPEEPITNLTAVESGYKHLQTLWCDACEISVKTTQEYCEHLIQKHNNKPIVCKKCSVFFQTYSQLYDHSVELHNLQSKLSPKTQLQYELPRETKPAKNKPSTRECPKCHKQIPYKLYRAHKIAEYQKARRRTKFTCNVCKKDFPVENKEEYKKHILEHRKERIAEKLKNSSIFCDYCDKKCLDEATKKSHMLQSHREYKPFKCDMCNKRYHAKNSLESHMHKHSRTNSTFLCDTCGSCFASPTLLHNHIHRQHNTKPCLFCNNQFGSILMKRHLDRVHFHERKYRCDICYNSFYSTTEVEAHKKLHRSKHAECHFCGKIFATGSSLNTHIEKRHQDDTGGYTCPVKSCQQQFALIYEIYKHCVGHSKDDFSKPRLGKREKLNLLNCKYCDTSFRYMSQYVYHVKQHDPGDVILVCGICNEEHSSEDSLTRHLETHEEAYDFDCRHCRETFVTDLKRDLHEKYVHRANGAVFQCTQCPKAFSVKYKLEYHKTTHSSERKVLCHLCSAKFMCKKFLDQHIATKHTHSMRQCCPECDKEFSYHFYLKKHYMNVHLKKKVYQCDHCDFERNVRKQVVEHMKEVHNISSLPTKNNAYYFVTRDLA